MKRGSTDGSGNAGNDADACAPGLLTLPSELRLWEFLDGGGIGGTQDLYSLSVAHRGLAHYAGLATRLDKVDDARLTSLLSAFERDRQHLAATTAAAAAAATVITIAVSTPSSPLTRAPVNLKHLAFGYWVDWEKVDQTMCEAFAQEVERVDSGLAALEVLDLSATRMHGYELQRVLRALGQRGAQSRLAVLHPPRMLGLEGDEGSILGYQGVHGELAQLPRLSEIHHVIGIPSTFVDTVLDLAKAHPEAASRLTTLALAGQYTKPQRRDEPAPDRGNYNGGANDINLMFYRGSLKPGCFANLLVLRLEAPYDSMPNILSPHGVWCLGHWWCNGVFGPLEEFSLRGHVRNKKWSLMDALLTYWRTAPAATFANLQVMRLQDFFWNFGEAVPLFDFFAETAGDGRFDRLRVLDLSDCSINDIAMGRLAAAMEAGFGGALEELDLSNSAVDPLTNHKTMGPEGVRFLCTGLQAYERTRLKRLKLSGHPLADDGLAEIVAAWREGNGALDALEELSVRRCDLTDEGLVEMVKAGFLGHQPALFGVDGADGASGPATPPPPARLRRLLIGDNLLRGQNQALPQLLDLGGSTSTLTRLDLNHNWGIGAEGLHSLLGLLGGGLRELKVGCGRPGQDSSRGDAMLRVVLEVAAPESPVLRDLRRLDIRHLDLSSAMITTELAAGLREGRFLRKLCQLELACGEVEGPGRAREEAAARMRSELIESRRPLVFDVLTINRRGWL